MSDGFAGSTTRELNAGEHEKDTPQKLQADCLANIKKVDSPEQLEKEIEAKIKGYDFKGAVQEAEDSTNKNGGVFVEDFQADSNNSRDSFSKSNAENENNYQDKHTDLGNDKQQEREGAIKPFSEQFPGEPDGQTFDQKIEKRIAAKRGM